MLILQDTSSTTFEIIIKYTSSEILCKSIYSQNVHLTHNFNSEFIAHPLPAKNEALPDVNGEALRDICSLLSI